ncbi:hypothetical protein PIB30_085250, partial [Stylosanthes scabra]|nr:hypothetical protein [Stylosanthes scabra]
PPSPASSLTIIVDYLATNPRVHTIAPPLVSLPPRRCLCVPHPPSQVVVGICPCDVLYVRISNPWKLSSSLAPLISDSSASCDFSNNSVASSSKVS